MGKTLTLWILWAALFVARITGEEYPGSDGLEGSELDLIQQPQDKVISAGSYGAPLYGPVGPLPYGPVGFGLKALKLSGWGWSPPIPPVPLGPLPGWGWPGLPLQPQPIISPNQFQFPGWGWPAPFFR